MEIRALRYFLAVAHEENITRAAEYLHLTQPTLSRQLIELEEEFGKKLFIRGKRKITLTEDGILFRKRATEIINLVDKTESEMTEDSHTISGDIYIGAGETDAMRLISHVAQEIHQPYPDIHYHIFSGDREEVKERLDKGLIDFGLIFGSVDSSKYHSLKVPSQATWGVLMRRDSPLASKSSICAKDLWDKNLLISRQANQEDFLREWIQRDLSKLNIIATYSLIYNASVMVSCGMGYALTLDKLINVSGDSDLCFRPCTPALNGDMSIIWKKYQVFSKPANLFLETLNQYFDELKKTE